MEPEKVKLYFILLRLKSYLVSLLDNPDECSNEFIYTLEFLNRRYPEKADEIIELLKEYEIYNDCEIAFDQNIHVKFKTIVEHENPQVDLETMLDELKIDTDDLISKEKELDKIKLEREKLIKYLLGSLFQLSKIWVAHKNLQVDIDNYSALDEEEILRPDEIEELKRLGVDSSLSFDVISKLTTKYLDELTEFYFRFGGNINLNSFINDLDILKIKVDKKYENLFKDHGLDPDIINGK